MNDAGQTCSIQPPRFNPGTRIGRFTVVSAGAERLVLRGHIGSSVLTVIGGLLLTVWGVFPWMALITGSDQSIPVMALVLAPGGLSLMVGGIIRATLRYTFDGEQRALIRASRFGKPETRLRGAFTHIAIDILPTNLEQRETIQVQLIQMGSAPGFADRTTLIGARRSTNKDAATLVVAGTEIARLLDHSIEVRGECKEGSPALLEALAVARTVVRASTPDDSPS